MTSPDTSHPAAAPILERLHRLMSTVAVYGDPIERNGLTVIPAARVVAGGGAGKGIDQAETRQGDGGGAGLIARPAGAFVIADGRVIWKPAVSLHTAAGLAIVAAIWLARGP